MKLVSVICIYVYLYYVCVCTLYIKIYVYSSLHQSVLPWMETVKSSEFHEGSAYKSVGRSETIRDDIGSRDMGQK